MAETIKIDKDKPLFGLIENTEKLLDANQALADELSAAKGDVGELKATVEKQAADLHATLERLDAMDKLLPKGNKVYLPLDGTAPGADDAAKDGLARLIVDAASFRLNGTPLLNSDEFKLAQTEGTDADGGYLVPAEQAAVIVKIVESYGLARKLCKMFPMKRDEMRIPVKKTGFTMYWPGESTAPGTESKVTFERPAITAKKMVGVDSLSIEIDEDSIPVIRDFLIDEAAIAVAKEEDTQCLKGNAGGSDPFYGILYDSGVTTLTMDSGDGAFSDLSYNYLVNLMDAIDEFAAERGVWVMSNYVLNLIRKLKDSDNRPLALSGILNMNNQLIDGGALSTQSPGTLFGRPLYRSPVMPKSGDSGTSKSFLIYGDLSLMGFGDRRKLSIDFSREADFKAGNVVMRIMERVGFKVLKGSGIGRLKTSATAS